MVKMMFRKFFLVILFSLTIMLQMNVMAYEEKESSSVPSNVGLSLNILGPLFGLYSAGISTYVSQYVQIGVYGTYFDTRNIEPQVTGWQSQVRLNLYFTAPNVSGVYLGLFGGYESVVIKKSDNKSDAYNDLIGGFVPGYKWAMTKKLNLLLGIMIGYMYGDIQVSPEISFVYSL